MSRPVVPIKVLAWLAVTVAVGLVAYLIGHDTHATSTVTVTGPGIADLGSGGGTAYVGADEPLDRQPYGFAYSMGRDISWTDASGSLHFGGRPTCLPVARAVRVKDIKAVQFTLPGGTGMGTVVWVHC